MRKLNSVIVKLAALVMVLAIVLVGCSQPGVTTSGSATSPAPSSTTAETPPTSISGVKGLGPDDPYTITFLWPLSNPPKGIGTKISNEVAARTGITFDIIPTTGNANEFHTLLLSSGDFPDVVTIAKGQQLSSYLESDALVDDLEPIANEYAPTFYSVLSDEENGNLVNIYKQMAGGTWRFWGMSLEVNRPGQKPMIDYYADPFYSTDQPEFSCFVLFPLVQELAEKRPDTLDGVYELYKAYMSKYGDNSHYAITTHSGAGGGLAKMANAIDGYGMINEDLSYDPKSGKDDEAIYYFFQENVLPFAKYLNKLYREGLMDPEGPVQTEEDAIAKLGSGNAFSSMGGWNTSYQASMAMSSVEGKEMSCFVPVQVHMPGKQYWNNNTASIGWRMVGITNKCKRPEKLLQFIEWYYTDPDAMILYGYGFKDEDYIINAEGEPDLNDELAASHTGDYYLNLGLSIGDNYSWLWALMPKPSRTVQGYPPEVAFCDYNRNIETGGNELQRLIADSNYNYFYDLTGTYFENYNYFGITMASDDPLFISKGTANAMINDAMMNMIMAKSEADVDAIYADTCQKMKDAGIQNYVDFMNEEAAKQK